jgi:ribosomal-protein-alanine N-acetyltransferase
VLRELVPADAEALYALRNDERVMRHIGRPRASSLADADELITRIAADRVANAGITWGLALKGSDRLEGTIGYYRLQLAHHRGEVGYLLAPERWGQGYMGEALEAVVDHGFRLLRFHSIEAVTDPGNEASNRLLARHGFIREGLFKENYFWEGRFLDSAVWSRLTPVR